MGSSQSKDEPKSPKSPKASKSPLSSQNFIQPKQEFVNTTPKKDLFKEVNHEVVSIQKSLSRTSINVNNELEKSASKSRFLDSVKQKKEIEQKREEVAKLERAQSQAKFEAEVKEEKQKENEKKSVAPAKIPINEFDEQPKKIDQIFGPMRDAPVISSSVYVDPDFDPGQKEISGINESVKLKKSKKPVKEEVKTEKFKFEMPSKSAKNPRPAKKEEPKPEPEPEPKEPTPEPPIIKDPTPVPDPPKEPTPEKESSPPPLKEITPELPVEEEDQEELLPRVSPTKILPPQIGINGFNGIGRLVLRAALESGLEVKAVNDPFVPLHYMVYMLKFDIAHSMNQYHQKEMTVRESPTGMLIVNGKAIHVFAEHDVTKIPWELAGVNYVIEATDALNTKAEASLHIKKSKKGLRMKHILEMQNGSGLLDGDELGPLTGGCRRVIIAGPSPDAPLAVVGVSEDFDSSVPVISHASAGASALAPVLSIIHKKFGIRTCSYTLLRSIRGHSKDSMKCVNLGPSSHSRSVKWDFAENLVPATMPGIEQEVLRLLPFLHKKFKGICVYVPTPQVSMIDLTLQLENDHGDTLYRLVQLQTTMTVLSSNSVDNNCNSNLCYTLQRRVSSFERSCIRTSIENCDEILYENERR